MNEWKKIFVANHKSKFDVIESIIENRISSVNDFDLFKHWRKSNNFYFTKASQDKSKL